MTVIHRRNIIRGRNKEDKVEMQLVLWPLAAKAVEALLDAHFNKLNSLFNLIHPWAQQAGEQGVVWRAH
jgi:hypothetical protein